MESVQAKSRNFVSHNTFSFKELLFRNKRQKEEGEGGKSKHILKALFKSNSKIKFAFCKYSGVKNILHQIRVLCGTCDGRCLWLWGWP